jgi:hypothetical protein
MYKYHFGIAVLVVIVGIVSVLKSDKDGQEPPKKRKH